MLLHWFPLFRVLVHCVYNRLAPPAEAYEETDTAREKNILWPKGLKPLAKYTYAYIHTYILYTHTYYYKLRLL